MLTLRLILVGCMVQLATACVSPVASLPELPMGREAPYLLGAGDRVSVTVFGEEALSGDFRVGADGDLSFPLIGRVPAVGRSLEEVRQTITARLANGLLVQPRVSAEIAEYRRIFVLGEVRAPGAYPFSPGMTVLEAVALAGGFTYRAAESAFTVTRQVAGNRIDGRGRTATRLTAGDVIYVHERHL
jgi:polysaccharide export outer membrane protein